MSKNRNSSNVLNKERVTIEVNDIYDEVKKEYQNAKGEYMNAKEINDDIEKTHLMSFISLARVELSNAKEELRLAKNNRLKTNGTRLNIDTHFRNLENKNVNHNDRKNIPGFIFSNIKTAKEQQIEIKEHLKNIKLCTENLQTIFNKLSNKLSNKKIQNQLNEIETSHSNLANTLNYIKPMSKSRSRSMSKSRSRSNPFNILRLFKSKTNKTKTNKTKSRMSTILGSAI